MTEHLELEDLLAAVESAPGGPAEVRDIGLLQAAVARPQATAFGEDAYRSLDAKAAALLQSIVAADPLVDGNKRLGWVALRLFYRLNEADVRPDANDAYNLVVSVASGEIRDIPEIASILEGWRPPI